MTYEEYFGDWLKAIDTQELNKVNNILNNLYCKTKICPDFKNVYKAFNLCPYNNLKIVFLGMDPYPQKGVATGILFGNKDDSNLSPSLKIIKEACINFEIPHKSIIFDPTLESWAKQGILMINAALTVEMNKTGSHTMLWRPFISKLLTNLSNNKTGIIYVLFGSLANTFSPYINSKYNHIIKVNHPAYYARTHTKMPYDLFPNISKLSERINGEPIIWYKEY